MTPEQLKASILQRAMEGKLVEQNPDDEPASELLKRIKSEKDRLISEGQIKKDKKETYIFKDIDGKYYEKLNNKVVQEIDVPFEIPESWEWVRLKSVTTFGNFISVKGIEIPNDSWVLDMEDLEKGTGNILRKVYKTDSLEFKSNKYKFEKGSILYGKLRPYLMKVGIADEDGFCTTEIFPIMPLVGLTNLFFRNIMLSQYFVKIVNQSSYGVKMPRVGTTFLSEMFIPIPPIKEQNRIVEQIEIAFKKVEEYAESYHKLEKLNTEFPEKLKKSFLQYAMEGKLVEQDLNDEPASELLKRIKSEKEKLVLDGKIKKDKNETYIFKDIDGKYYEKLNNKVVQEIDIPFEIPGSWEWAKISNICTSNIGLTYKPSDVKNSGIPVYKANNIKNGSINLDMVTYVSEDIKIKNNEWLSENDVLMAVRSGSKHLVGKAAVIKTLKEKTSFGAFMSVIRPIKINSNFLNIYFESLVFRSQLDAANTTTIFQVTQKMLKNSILPIPPIEEQKRIVEQIELALTKFDEYAESIIVSKK